MGMSNYYKRAFGIIEEAAEEAGEAVVNIIDNINEVPENTESEVPIIKPAVKKKK